MAMERRKRGRREAMQRCSRAFTRIKDVSPYVNHYTICGHCTAKSELRSFTRLGSKRAVFDFHLEDKTGELKISAFGDAATAAYRQVAPGRTYTLSNATVRPLTEFRRQYNRTGHACELILEVHSQLDEAKDEEEDQVVMENGSEEEAEDEKLLLPWSEEHEEEEEEEEEEGDEEHEEQEEVKEEGCSPHKDIQGRCARHRVADPFSPRHWPPPLIIPKNLITRPPEEFFCPITREVMREPAVTCSGVSYERAAVLGWLAAWEVDAARQIWLCPNLALRQAMVRWLDKHKPHSGSADGSQEGAAAAAAAAGAPRQIRSNGKKRERSKKRKIRERPSSSSSSGVSYMPSAPKQHKP